MKATSAGKDLVLLEKRLIRQIDMAFPRLSRQASSSAALNQDAMTLGHSDGQNLDWKKRINSKESSKSKTLKLLGF
jgi:myo-inositol-1-phosphate synthase